MQACLIPLGNASLDARTQNDVNTLSSFGIVTNNQTWGPVKYIAAPFNYAGALFDMMTVNGSGAGNPVFSSFTFFQWIVIAPLLAGLVFGFIMAFYSILSSVLT